MTIHVLNDGMQHSLYGIKKIFLQCYLLFKIIAVGIFAKRVNVYCRSALKIQMCLLSHENVQIGCRTIMNRDERYIYCISLVSIHDWYYLLYISILITVMFKRSIQERYSCLAKLTFHLNCIVLYEYHPCWLDKFTH